MEATVLSWRFQNILSIIVIILGIGLIATLGGQVFQMSRSNSQQVARMNIINWSIIGAWQNWLLVAFAATLLCFVMHLFMRKQVYGAFA